MRRRHEAAARVPMMMAGLLGELRYVVLAIALLVPFANSSFARNVASMANPIPWRNAKWHEQSCSGFALSGLDFNKCQLTDAYWKGGNPGSGYDYQSFFASRQSNVDYRSIFDTIRSKRGFTRIVKKINAAHLDLGCLPNDSHAWTSDGTIPRHGKKSCFLVVDVKKISDQKISYAGGFLYVREFQAQLPSGARRIIYLIAFGRDPYPYNYNKKFDYYYRAFSGVIMTPQNVFFPASKIESILSSVKFEGKKIIDQ